MYHRIFFRLPRFFSQYRRDIGLNMVWVERPIPLTRIEAVGFQTRILNQSPYTIFAEMNGTQLPRSPQTDFFVVNETIDNNLVGFRREGDVVYPAIAFRFPGKLSVFTKADRRSVVALTLFVPGCGLISWGVGTMSMSPLMVGAMMAGVESVLLEALLLGIAVFPGVLLVCSSITVSLFRRRALNRFFQEMTKNLGDQNPIESTAILETFRKM